METVIRNFLRRVVLDAGAAERLREEALSMLLGNAFVLVKISGTENADQTAEISREDYLKVNELLRTGVRISAIKFLREITGLGLKPAKETIDAWNYHM